MWDGEAWEPLGAGFDDGSVRSLVVYNNELIAGGFFTESNGVMVNRIARWDGNNWQPLGDGFNGSVRTLTVHNGELIAGGAFTRSGGTTLNYIARWNGSNWEALAEGFDNTVEALTTYNDDLIAGGWFTSTGIISANRVARWDGSNWQPLGSGVSAVVYSLSEYQNDLYLTGEFQTAGDKASARFARWSTEPVNVSNMSPNIPGSFVLHQNYPNPFNPVTTILFSVPEQSHVELRVYDLLGREVQVLVNDVKLAGTHTVELDARSLPSGVYFYRINTPSFIETKRMILLR
jgi:hypothetical protein